MRPDAGTLLEVSDLHVSQKGEPATVDIVAGIDFRLRAGEVLGIVGESGCGKSVSMLSLVGILPPALAVRAGRARFEGQDLLALDEAGLERVRGSRIGFVFQDPMTSFNPVMTIGAQLAEPLRYHLAMGREEALAEAGRLMRRVGIPGAERRLTDYPHQLSGGMRQRVMIAMSIACRPGLLIADEPTTALDVTTQAQIVDLIAEIRDELGLAVLWVSHDLALVSQIADTIAVLYSGKIVEIGPAEQICAEPAHPYTRALIGAMPGSAPVRSRRLVSIGGMPPDPARRPPGCAFAPRCPSVFARCRTVVPPLAAAGGRDVACLLYGASAAVAGVEATP